MLVEPGVAIGPVRLGMTRAEVASTLGAKPVAFERLGTPNDEFSGVGLQCGYDANGCLEAIEAHDPAVLDLFGCNPLELTVLRLRSHLGDVGIEILGEDAAGFVAPGFSVYAEDDIVQSVAVFGKEYQQNLLALYR